MREITSIHSVASSSPLSSTSLQRRGKETLNRDSTYFIFITDANEVGGGYMTGSRFSVFTA